MVEHFRINENEYFELLIYSIYISGLQQMAGKLVNIKLHTRRLQRVVKDSRSVCTCDCRRANVTDSKHLS